MSTNWKDTSHDLGEIAYVYRLKGHELRFDPRRRRPAYEDVTFQVGTDKLSNQGSVVTSKFWSSLCCCLRRQANYD